MGKSVTVQPGDTLLSIAHGEGIFDWNRIWNHGQNSSLRQQRSNPQVLYPGDQVYVPDKSESFKQLTLDVDQVHTFRTRQPACFFSVYLKDECGQPYAGHNYRVKLGASTYEGQTSDQGLVCHPVTPEVQTGELTLWRSKEDPDNVFTWTLQVGHLNPVEFLSGVKARLRNLGYQTGPINEELDEQTRAAIESFQIQLGYDPPTGQPDERTRKELVRLENDH